ncbi:3823_t:CDS:2 [Gigaspora margarita]|uniref:3823_t:CDS:1 n=1 Tax=Gigaspora margarita TaxID=4874 RepID=A0ABN7VQU6_GIGMA|nr:3823_t:CDS:2 [Gigaspora margarita]
MADIITIHCLVLGDTPPDEHVLPITVSKKNTILDLKKNLKNERKNDLANIDACNLKLWKVNIPLNILNKKLDAFKNSLDINIEKMLDGESLHSISKICKVFPDEPSDECIHIIVQYSAGLCKNDDLQRIEDHQRIEDPQRTEIALLVSQAIYKDDPIQFLNRRDVKIRHRFKEICVANKNGIGTPYLIAFSSSESNEAKETKEVYIAFRGAWSTQNWIQSIKILPHYIGFKGMIHSGFKKIAEQIPFDLLTRFIEFEKIKRITLCGHSLGGAVSHTYLLLYFIFSNGGSTLPEDLDILSIAFGSPFVADNEIRKWLQKQPNFSKCFWTFVHEKDGVPRSLNLVGNCAHIKRVYDNIEIYVQTLGQVFPTIGKYKEHADKAKSFYEKLLDNPIVKRNMYNVYQPFGLWFFCKNKEYKIFDASNQPEDVIERLEVIEINAESILDDSIDKYYAVLKNTINFSKFANMCDEDSSPVMNSNRFSPKIELIRAELHKPNESQNLESSKCKIVIEITGDNLNFLSESAVELINFMPHNIVHLTPSKTSKEVLMNSNILIVEGFVNYSNLINTKLCSLKIKTHFDTAEQVIPESNWKTKILKRAEKFVNEATEDLLHKAIQRCFVMRKNGGGKVAESLLNAVTELERVVLDRNVSKIGEFFNNKLEIGDEFLEMEKKTNPICCDIINRISSEISVKKKYDDNTIRFILGIFCVDGMFTLGGLSAALAAEVVTAGSSLEGAIAGCGLLNAVLCSYVGGNYITSLHKCEAKYREIIKFLLQQLKSLKNLEDVEFINSPFHTEETLVNQWEALGYMNKNSKEIVEDMPFRTDGIGLYVNADDNSIKNAVHRIRSIIHLHDVRKKLIEHVFLIALGPQNAGKTTALVKLFPGMKKLSNSDTIQIGIGSHTRNFTTYEFDHLSIVDSPGLNTVNENEYSALNIDLPEKLRNNIRQSCTLASIILCIFKFEGSVTAELIALVDLVKPYLGEVPVLFCLNQAVEKMNIEDGLKDLDATNKWHDKMINNLGLSPELMENLEFKFTDFVSKNYDSIKCGIWSVDDVKQWIRDKIRDQLSFIKDDEKLDEILRTNIE